jgi:hypothetical protein
VYAIWLLNFISFLVGAATIGGDAVNGKAEAGRFYVSDHGKLTEVSRAVFTYSRFHCYATWMTHAMAVICALLFGPIQGSDKSSDKKPRVV